MYQYITLCLKHNADADDQAAMAHLIEMMREEEGWLYEAYISYRSFGKEVALERARKLIGYMLCRNWAKLELFNGHTRLSQSLDSDQTSAIFNHDSAWTDDHYETQDACCVVFTPEGHTKFNV